MEQEEKIKELTDKLENGIREMFESEKYKNYLSVMSRFHNYSANNMLLIALQKPEASYVAGFMAWKREFQRNVKKGEKAIQILAPCPYKVKRLVQKTDPVTGQIITDETGKPLEEVKEVAIPAYKVVSVFDVSQTEGKKLPEIAENLQGNVKNYTDMVEALKIVSPVPISFEIIDGGVNGYYHLVEKRIAFKEKMSEMQNIKTMIHEISHACLHNRREGENSEKDTNTKEVEAESIAYVVCQHYGIDTSEYSFGYIAGWSSSRETVELKESLGIIRKTATDMINGIDKVMTEKKEKVEGIKKEEKRLLVEEGEKEVKMKKETVRKVHRRR